MANGETQQRPLLRFRDGIREVSPWWLRLGTMGKLMYAIGLHVDALLEMGVAAVKRRLPGAEGLLGHDALAPIGRDRRMRRGRVESDSNYAARLPKWLDLHALRGGPYGLLRMLYHHYAPAAFDIELVHYPSKLGPHDPTTAVRYTLSSKPRPVFVGVGAPDARNTSGDLEPTLPAGTHVGDLLLLHIEQNSTLVQLEDPPEGWVQIAAEEYFQVQAVHAKIATAEDIAAGSVTHAVVGAYEHMAAVSAFRPPYRATWSRVVTDNFTGITTSTGSTPVPNPGSAPIQGLRVALIGYIALPGTATDVSTYSTRWTEQMDLISNDPSISDFDLGIQLQTAFQTSTTGTATVSATSVGRSLISFYLHAAGAAQPVITRDLLPNFLVSDIDSVPRRWPKWWLFYHWPTKLLPDGDWDDEPGDEDEWNDGGVWDNELNPIEVGDARLIPEEWNAAHPTGRVVYLGPGESIEDFIYAADGTPTDIVWDDADALNAVNLIQIAIQ